jgi:hypothetical protein
MGFGALLNSFEWQSPLVGPSLPIKNQRRAPTLVDTAICAVAPTALKEACPAHWSAHKPLSDYSKEEQARKCLVPVTSQDAVLSVGSVCMPR